MFQKIDEMFQDLSNVFGIADGILIVGYDTDGRDHDRTLRHVMQICQWENLKKFILVSLEVHQDTDFLGRDI